MSLIPEFIFFVVELKPANADVKERKKKKDDSSDEPKQKRPEKIALVKDSSEKDDTKVGVNDLMSCDLCVLTFLFLAGTGRTHQTRVSIVS